MNRAVTPLMGSLAAASCRSVPGPASTKKTREPATTAVAGPEAFGSGLGVPVPYNTTAVFSAVSACGGVSAPTGVTSAQNATGKIHAASPATKPLVRSPRPKFVNLSVFIDQPAHS
jgi:hypothetical protein